MPRTYFDYFTKLTLPKMAQAIADIAYSYKETKVPAKHYKDALSTDYAEMLEANVSVKLVDTIYNMLAGLEKESPGADVKIMDRFFRHREVPDSEKFLKE